MPVTVYADVLVIVNLYVDFFLLWCTQQVLQLRAGPWRMVLGAFVGGLCALACLYPLPWWGSLLWGGASAALVTAAAFCPLSRRGFLKTALCFWLFSLALAGFFPLSLPCRLRCRPRPSSKPRGCCAPHE